MGTHIKNQPANIGATVAEIGAIFNQQRYGEAYKRSKDLYAEVYQKPNHRIMVADYWMQRVMIELHLGKIDDACRNFARARICPDFNPTMERAFKRDLALVVIRRLPKKPCKSIMEIAGSNMVATVVEDLLEPMRTCESMNERACRSMLLGRKSFERARKLHDHREKVVLLNEALRHLKAAAITWNLLLPETVNVQWKLNYTYTLFKVVRLCEKLAYPEISLKGVPSSKQLYDEVKASDPSGLKVRAAGVIMYYPEMGYMVEEVGLKLRTMLR